MEKSAIINFKKIHFHALGKFILAAVNGKVIYIDII